MNTTRLTGNIGFYAIGAISKLLQILLIPLYSSYLNPVEFGYYNLIITIITLAIPLLYQSIWEGVLRFTIDNKDKKRIVLTTTFLYSLGLTIIYCLIFIVTLIFFPLNYGVLILFVGILQMATSLWQFSARALNYNKKYTFSVILETLSLVIVSYILIVVLNLGLAALFLAYIISKCIGIVILENEVKLFSSLKLLDFDTKLLKTILWYSIPLCINAISWWMISSSSSFIVSFKLGLEENGVLSLALRFGAIMTLFTSVINMAWLEESFKIDGTKNSDKYFNEALDGLIRFILSGVIVLTPITFLFYHFFVSDLYIASSALTPLVYLNAAFAAIATHLGSGFLMKKQSKTIFHTTLLGGVSSILFALLVINYYGLMGVMISSLLGTIIMLGVRIPLLKKLVKLRINFKLIGILTLVSLITLYLCNSFKEYPLIQILISVLSIVAFIVFNKKLIYNFKRKSDN